MPVSVQVSDQLSFVENGLKSLKKSWLMGAREFKDMYCAVERHHRDLKLAHLTGKARDLLEQACKDTRFYNILIKMMVEVHTSPEKKRSKQRQDLKKIYSWYQANKHVLHCEPHFGKKYQKEKGQQIFKSELVKKETHTKQEDIPDEHLSFGEEIYELGEESRPTSVAAQATASDEASLPPQYKEPRPSTAPSSSGLSYPPKPSRPKSAAIDFDFKNERAVVKSEDEPSFPENAIHPLRSLINPHLQMGSYDDQQEALPDSNNDLNLPESRSASPVKIQIDVPGANPISPTSKRRPKTALESRQEKLAEWKNYQEEQKRQQGVLGSLQLCGRSGTPYDVRYSAHESGETPEDNLPSSASQNKAKSSISEHDRRSRSLIIAQSLERFYKTAENYYPLERRQPFASQKLKPKSAPPGGRQVSFAMDRTESPAQKTVKLNTVLNMVDDVSNTMVSRKEKMGSRPLPGYKYASASVPSISRPQTAPVTLKRQTTNTPSHTPRHSLESGPVLNLRPPEHSSYSVHFQKELTEGDTSVSSLLQAVDWRGQISPESTHNNRWSPTRFGGHTYVKKLKQIQSLRTQGGTHAGHRPKTAAVTTQEKWQTKKLSDSNKKVTQAASHMTTEVEPRFVNQLVQVQYLGKGDNGVGYSAADQEESLYKLSLARGSSASFSQRGLSASSKEYMSFVAPKSLLDTALRRNIATPDNTLQETFSLPPDVELSTLISSPPPVTQTSTLGDYLSMVSSAHRNADDSSDQAYSTAGGDFDLPDINDLDEDLGSNFQNDIDSRDGDFSEFGGDFDTGNPDDTFQDGSQADIVQGEDDKCSDATSVTRISVNNETDMVEREQANLMVSIDEKKTDDVGDCADNVVIEEPRFINGDEVQTQYDNSGDVLEPPSDHVCTCSHEQGEVDEDNLHIQGTSLKDRSKYTIRGEHWSHAIKRPENYCKTCRPNSVRFAPVKSQRAQGGLPPPTERILLHREQHHPARPLTAPHKTPPSIPSPHCPYGIRSPRLGHSYNPELDHHALRSRSPRHFMENVSELRSVDRGLPVSVSHHEVDELAQSIKIQKIGTKVEELAVEAVKQQNTVDTPSPIVGEPLSKGQDVNQNIYIGQAKEWTGSDVSRPSIASIGRPIAHYHNIKDPDLENEAAVLMKQACAAVDIQRIFRGYAARNVYKKLLRDNREKREDQRKAAIEIQRIYRGHLSRKKDIYRRKPNPETIEWARNFKAIQVENELARVEKAEARTQRSALNHNQAASKLAIIGPHVDMYEIFHPVKAGPIKTRLRDAAVIIQRHVRGWLVRRMFEALKRKARVHASSWDKFVTDYKDLLARIQRRHGVNKPSRPFNPDHLNKFMDLKRRYESVFEKRSFGGELELDEFPLYFKECDLYPSQAEIDHAVDIVFKFQKRKTVKGYTKKEMLEVTFQLFVPEGTGLQNTRQSTWMHPIVDGEDAMQMHGSDEVESAPLGPCVKLVAESVRQRKLRGQEVLDRQKEEEERQQEMERRERAKQIQAEIEREDRELKKKLAS